MIGKPYKDCILGQVSQKFGVPNNYPPYKHTGVDFVSWYGTPLLAPINCKITNIIEDIPFQSQEAEEQELRNGYGIVMQDVEKPDTYYIYWHCTGYFPVEIGQLVMRGDMVGQMGNSGYVLVGGQYVPIGNRYIPPYKGTHLHFEGFRETNGKREYFDVLPLIDFNEKIEYKQSIIQSMSVILQKMAGTLKK